MNGQDFGCLLLSVDAVKDPGLPLHHLIALYICFTGSSSHQIFLSFFSSLAPQGHREFESAMQAVHNKPMPTVEKFPTARHTSQVIHQPRKWFKMEEVPSPHLSLVVLGFFCFFAKALFTPFLGCSDCSSCLQNIPTEAKDKPTGNVCIPQAFVNEHNALKRNFKRLLHRYSCLFSWILVPNSSFLISDW